MNIIQDNTCVCSWVSIPSLYHAQDPWPLTQVQRIPILSQLKENTFNTKCLQTSHSISSLDKEFILFCDLGLQAIYVHRGINIQHIECTYRGYNVLPTYYFRAGLQLASWLKLASSDVPWPLHMNTLSPPDVCFSSPLLSCQYCPTIHPPAKAHRVAMR